MRGKVVCSEGAPALGSIENCKIAVPAVWRCLLPITLLSLAAVVLLSWKIAQRLFSPVLNASSVMNMDMFTDIKDELNGQEQDIAEATATANTLADISTLITQQNKNYSVSRPGGSESNEKRPRRGRVAEHPCWELVQRVDEHNCMICRICSKVVKCLNTRNAMQHFSSCHPQIAVELDQSWQMKLQLKADFNRLSSETSLFRKSHIVSLEEKNQTSDRSMWKRRGRAAEHPSWRYFCRINRKSSNCKLCGVHVAYACSGNLMKHLKSRHLAEFAITQREWEEILKRKKQLCELRLKVSSNVSGSEEQSPSNFLSYEYEDEQDEGLGGDGIEGEEDGKLLELFGNVELFDQSNGNDNDGTVSNETESKLDNFDDQTSTEQHDAAVEPSVAGDAKIMDVSETANRILQSIGFSSHPAKSPSPGLQQQGSWLTQTSFGTKNDAFRRRINFFVNGLAEDLASFPMEKSLLCMRQIRKYMDEKLIGLEGSIQNSEVDTNIT
uniref:BED-type domain-containing protein n=1 Tax=Setaria digitata TaxID=48799 RepID=A0A915PRI1_9BILA